MLFVFKLLNIQNALNFVMNFKIIKNETDTVFMWCSLALTFVECGWECLFEMRYRPPHGDKSFLILTLSKKK